MTDFPSGPPTEGEDGDAPPPPAPRGAPQAGQPRDPAGPPPALPGGWVPPGGVQPPGGDRSLSGEDPDDGPARRSSRVALVAVAVIGVLALVGGTVAFFVGDDEPTVASPDVGDPADPGVTGSSSTVPTSDGPTSTSPPASVDRQAFLALVDELQAYVAEARELEFQRPVQVELEDEETFNRRLLEDFEEEIDRIEEAEVFYRALGLLDPDADLLEELRAVFSAGVLGFYDPETEELVLRGTEPTPYVQQTIVHELVHALDDQHFELHREQYDDRDDEIGTGFTALVEGNAKRIENQWLSEQPADFRETVAQQEQAFVAGTDFSVFPEILLFEISAPYQLGPIFVRQLLEQGGERTVDAAFADPPTTSEQVLFPPLYLEREPRIEVPPPPADGEIVEDGVIGALFLLALLNTGESTVDPNDAFLAIQGWGGDWGVTWEEGDVDCVRFDVVGDTDRDTDEIESALRAWAENSPASVSVIEERVRVESCVTETGATPPEV